MTTTTTTSAGAPATSTTTTPTSGGAPSTPADHYDRLLAEHYTWMLGGHLPDLVAEQRALLAELGLDGAGDGDGDAGGERRLAVDLGCGPGHTSLALAGLGYDRVLAVDLSRPLLAELAGYAAEVPAVRPVHADLRTALRELVGPGTADAVVCLGDTLTHLPTRGDVAALLNDVAGALTPDGTAVLAYRDLTVPLTGTDRFLPVRATEDRIMTCFLEYPADFEDYTVVVHDLVHSRTGADDDWTLTTGSYRKLRLSHDWVLRQCRTAGLAVVGERVGQGGVARTVALRLAG
ncbi:class I SAM-dependent methyltransferase [Streptomyces sp. DSM 44915]|uniref:Class I SAM-dependent methyltransferase n=1 Tax=Streptomyces chisholmiae TaxID=3075540 RepID=A0ABU2JQ57_9ACTN|nr:class I SAM-dependent methyltransferase [Streptomyces sp. DSM 44915]MDT0266348.1 class I SAM-dependent methyltransferase [Streptomyces sp. DSM 44915]